MRHMAGCWGSLSVTCTACHPLYPGYPRHSYGTPNLTWTRSRHRRKPRCLPREFNTRRADAFYSLRQFFLQRARAAHGIPVDAVSQWRISAGDLRFESTPIWVQRCSPTCPYLGDDDTSLTMTHEHDRRMRLLHRTRCRFCIVYW